MICSYEICQRVSTDHERFGRPPGGSSLVEVSSHVQRAGCSRGLEESTSIESLPACWCGAGRFQCNRKMVGRGERRDGTAHARGNPAETTCSLSKVLRSVAGTGRKVLLDVHRGRRQRMLFA